MRVCVNFEETAETMSYDSDEKLPESLEKLQLVPLDTLDKQFKCSLHRNENPFVVNVPSKSGTDEQQVYYRIEISIIHTAWLHIPPNVFISFPIFIFRFRSNCLGRHVVFASTTNTLRAIQSN